MEWQSFAFGVLTIFVLLLLMITLGFAHIGSSNFVEGNSADSGKIDTTGWTQNEIMNYEMHGTIPARAQRR